MHASSRFLGEGGFHSLISNVDVSEFLDNTVYPPLSECACPRCGPGQEFGKGTYKGNRAGVGTASNALETVAIDERIGSNRIIQQ